MFLSVMQTFMLSVIDGDLFAYVPGRSPALIVSCHKIITGDYGIVLAVLAIKKF